MKIYLLKSKSDPQWDIPSEAVVIAESEEDAFNINPAGKEPSDNEFNRHREWEVVTNYWSKDNLEISEIGTAGVNAKRGIVLINDNASW